MYHILQKYLSISRAVILFSLSLSVAATHSAQIWDLSTQKVLHEIPCVPRNLLYLSTREVRDPHATSSQVDVQYAFAGSATFSGYSLWAQTLSFNNVTVARDVRRGGLRYLFHLLSFFFLASWFVLLPAIVLVCLHPHSCICRPWKLHGYTEEVGHLGAISCISMDDMTAVSRPLRKSRYFREIIRILTAHDLCR